MKSSQKWQYLANSPIVYIFNILVDSQKYSITKLGDIIQEIKTGKTPSKNNPAYYNGNDIFWYKPEDIGNKIYLNGTNSYLSKIAVDENKVTIYNENTLLINCIGDIGRASILNHKASSNQQITGIQFNRDISTKFMYFYFLSNYYKFKKESQSTTLPIINQKKLLNLNIKLLDFSNQDLIGNFLIYCIECLDKNIVPINEGFDFNQNIKDKINKIFNIYYGEKKTKNYLTENLNLFSKLRQSILQDAIQGKLVKQDSNDESASILLKKIKEEKERLIGDGTNRKQKELIDIKKDEIPFNLPKGWEWVRMGDITYKITDGTHNTPNYISNGIPFLSVKDVAHGTINFNNTKFISKEEHNELSKRCNPEFGDILLTKVGTTGIAKLIDIKKDFSIFVSIALIKFFKESIYGKYFEYCINSPFVKRQSEEGTEGIGNKNLVLRKIHDFLIPIPPLEEQKRIVEKIEELMKYCDELEKQVNEAKNSSEKLMEGVLQEVFKK